MAACSAGSDPGAAASSTADRAISWRNASPRPLRSSRPVAASLATTAGDSSSAWSNALLTPFGAQASSSMLCRSSGARPAVRAITASRTLSGSGASGWSMIWLMKKGLPAVRRCTSAASRRRWPSRSFATAVRLRGASCRRRARCGDEIAEHGAQRGNGVAIGHDHQQGSRRSAGEETHEVGGRLVGPVQVLDDEDARGAAERRQHRREDFVLGCRAAEARGHRGIERVRDVAERAQRTGGAQRIAHAPQDRYRGLLGERVQQRCLADARLAREQDETSCAPGRAFRSGLQHLDGVVALQQPHRRSVIGQIVAGQPRNDQAPQHAPTSGAGILSRPRCRPCSRRRRRGLRWATPRRTA